ncbi:unnamed protein product, partial [Rotaria sordida]
FPDEDEVLILPYSPFQITKIVRNDQQRRTEIHLEECDAAALLTETSFRPNKIGKIFDNGNNVKSNMEEINERRLES